MKAPCLVVPTVYHMLVILKMSLVTYYCVIVTKKMSSFCRWLE
jgi:hypothetical protein